MLFKPPAQRTTPVIRVKPAKLKKKLRLLQCCSGAVISNCKRGVTFHGSSALSNRQVLSKQRGIEAAIRANKSVHAARRIVGQLKAGPVEIVMGRMTGPRFKCFKAVAAITGKVVTLTRTGKHTSTLTVTTVPIDHVAMRWVRVQDDGTYGAPFINPTLNKHRHNVRLKRPAPEKRGESSSPTQ